MSGDKVSAIKRYNDPGVPRKPWEYEVCAVIADGRPTPLATSLIFLEGKLNALVKEVATLRAESEKHGNLISNTRTGMEEVVAGALVPIYDRLTVLENGPRWTFDTENMVEETHPPAPKEAGGLVEAAQKAYNTAYMEAVGRHCSAKKAEEAGTRAAIAATADWLDGRQEWGQTGQERTAEVREATGLLRTQLKAD